MQLGGLLPRGRVGIKEVGQALRRTKVERARRIVRVGELTPRRHVLVGASLLGAALGAWIVSVKRMRGMDAGPGTDLGGLGWYLGVWLSMMAAMMLPSVAPTVVLFARLRPDGHTWAFVVGYLLAWTGYGLLAYVLYRVVRVSAPSFLAWEAHGPLVAGGALAAAGLYQFTALKREYLRRCRSPLLLLLHGRAGRLGALRTGAVHGGYCVGCCTGLMLALFALGVMSLVWMAVVAVAILVEKWLRGQGFTHLLAVALVGLGIWVGVSPDSVPGLQHQSDTRMGMEPHR